MPEILLSLYIEGYGEGEGGNFDIKQLFMEQLHEFLCLGPHFYCELPDCSLPQSQPRLHQQLCLVPAILQALFTALGSLGAGVIGEK